MKLSIVIPVLDEAATLPALLERVAPLRACGTEVIIVDGGSRDGSPTLVERAGVALVRAQRGRARQMNAGAAAARGDVLLFLHADTELPPFADQAVLAALATGRHVWGRFDVSIIGRHWMLPVVATMMNLRSRLTGIATGDQGIFMTRAACKRIGGFEDIPLMEDIAASRALRRLSRPAIPPATLQTSARRWQRHGIIKTIVTMWGLRLAYFLGVPSQRLARYYSQHS